VNDDFIKHIRKGLISYKRGDTQSFTSQGVKFNQRGKDSKPGDKGEITVETADVYVILLSKRLE
jgi:dimethylaniline monooxygenase (N-oxide forming)